MFIKICLIKTLLEKNPMEKKYSEGKKVQHPFVSKSASLKTLSEKFSGIKPWLREKEYITHFCLPS